LRPCPQSPSGKADQFSPSKADCARITGSPGVIPRTACKVSFPVTFLRQPFGEFTSLVSWKTPTRVTILVKVFKK
jgi:hypothetical protein